ncbi:MAG: hypothetical protein N3I35_04805 [Clostridia bacterium]|nr:hypothetical protein [Clostridia bacterium]
MQEKGIIKLVDKRSKYIVPNMLVFYRGSTDKRNAPYNEYGNLNVKPSGGGGKNIR